MSDNNEAVLDVVMDRAPAEVPPPVRIEATLTPRLNLAFHQNAVPVLHELVLVNDGDAPLEAVELTLTSEPAFVAPKTWRIDAVPAGQRYHVPKLDVTLDGAMLGRLTEAESATVTITAAAAGSPEPVARTERSLELLARNQWGGVGNIPEMIAAFVQPNDPAVERVLKKAANILRQNGKSGALNGYEGGPKRAWELATAIWGAVGALGLDYALPPPSFEHAGQKVRGPSQVLDSGLATCLDSALLFAAALEHCGLNPLIVFTRGHAFAGVWLRREEFTTPVVDDVTALRKRAKLKELALFETTLATHRPCPSFAVAADHAFRQIEESVEDTFELAVDVRRARLQRIRPLANAESTVTADYADADAEASEPLFAEPPADLPDDLDDAADDAGPASPKDRLERWQRKLLDLSLRNALLNFRAGKRALVCDAPDPGLLEDLLAEGRSLRLLPRPALMDGNDPRSQAIHEGRTLEDLHRQHALEALGRNEVLVGLKGDDLDTRLTELYRTARAAMQEGGANTLFLALGFLSWMRDGTRDSKDAKRHRAPLILIPVTLQRKSVRSGFNLVLHDDEPRFNPTLLQMLRQDFRLTIPVAEGDLPRDDSGLDIAGIWKAVRQAVKDIPGWEVTEDVVLATFSFAKYLMWKDLVDRTEQLKQSPVVRHLIETPRDPFPSDLAFPNPRDLDATHGPEHTFCPLPADSSQLSAVMAAARGKNFVLVGPPGTGKSQTIANLIAQFLAERKSVLFVSEKIAALDVVYRRLREVGLGEFCLELHSSKSRKLDVLDQLRRAWDAKGDTDADTWRKEAQRLKGLRDQLNGFVARLHHRHRNGLTVHAAIGRVVAGRHRLPLGLSWPSADAHDEATLDALRELADRLGLHAREVGSISDSPLRLVTRAEFSSHWRHGLIAAARELAEAGDALTDRGDAFLRATGLPGRPLDRKTRSVLGELARVLPQAAGRDWRFVLRPDAGRLADRLREGMRRLEARRALLDALSPALAESVTQGLRRGLDLLAKHRELAGQLSVAYGAGVATLDVDGLKAEWAKAQQSIWPLRGMRSKAVVKALMAASDGSCEPDVAADLERLAALRAVTCDIEALAPAVADAGPVWAGLDTDVEAVQSLLAFQAVLPAALSAAPWSESGLGPIAEGRCGGAAAGDLQRLHDLRTLEREVEDLDDLRTITGGLWNGLRTRAPDVEAALTFQAALSAAIARLAATPDELASVKGPLDRLIGDGNALLAAGGPVETAGQAFLDALDRYDAALRTLAELSGSSEAQIDAAVGETPSRVAAASRGIPPLEPKLHSWCAWRRTRDDAMVRGLAPLVAAMEQGRVAVEDLRDAFESDYCRWWLDGVVDDDEVLRSFVSAEHEKRIADFRALDERFTDLTRAHIRAGLCAGLPDQDSVGKSSEWGILRREMQKKRAHMPLRELIGRLPTAVTKLAPCLLMSPLSIAQFLSAETAPFDVVVFDEASQIPVWDAIGAIARGRQVVMVGDPKQLPPTAFFDRAEADEDDDGDVDGDLESILDECLGANLPARSLNWHYRSRHESLIAFSNHRYYEGGLVTFPSPVTDDRAVSLHLVADGTYEKGGARINKPEARALVAHLVARLKDPAFRAAGLTVGVVTFNSEQQRLIEDLLDEERRKAPEIEPHFAEDAIEPVFVKNLESVQGDERDVMYFSITYGPDLTGAVSMNFGPMNRDGGERRLNVAVTRARHELRVFSSLRPEQFDLSRTAALGVRDLKHFLEFAERGPRALAEAVRGSVGEHESPFEHAVARALAARGWQVQPQIGVSSFRIDLGVVDPDAPGRFLAGIECDGATYHRSATARDRDKLRELVLRGLGWEIVRIWSTDWWHDHDGALDKVDARLSALLEASRARRAGEVRRLEEAALAAAAAPDDTMTVDTAEDAEDVAPPLDDVRQHDEAPDGTGHRPADDLFQGSDLMQPSMAYARNASAAPPPDTDNRFREADPLSAVCAVNPDAFFDREYTAPLQAMIDHVITVEGPVRDDVLARRIARTHGWLRTGSKIRDRVVTLARARFPMVQEEVGAFFWPAGADQTRWPSFRRPAGDEPRPVDEIALPELVALARAVKDEGITGEDAITAMARDAGLQKLRAASRDRLRRAWTMASSGECE
ncbi:DUF3320 domain-containing protein [Roseomonas genomospecies 6]|nr:DUF3320 domain-containing protein [Roseomonas genomospecies 6]